MNTIKNKPFLSIKSSNLYKDIKFHKLSVVSLIISFWPLMGLYFHSVRILLALWDLVEKYSCPLHKESLNFKTRKLYLLHAVFIIHWLWVISEMFIVGEEGSKVNSDYSSKFKLHQHLNTLHIFLNMIVLPKTV